MFDHLAAQPAAIVLATILALTLVCATCLFVGVRIAARRPLRFQFASFMPVLVPLCTILALLLSFLAARLWENFDTAVNNLNTEATSLSQIFSASQYLNSPARERIRSGVRQHIDHSLGNDWARLKAGDARRSTNSPGLAEIGAALIFNPRDDGERIAQNLIASNLQRASDAHGARLRAGHYQPAGIVWFTLAGLSLLCILGTILTTADHPVVSAVSTLIVSIGFALVLAMLVVFDSPFSGALQVSPQPLTDLLLRIRATG